MSEIFLGIFCFLITSLDDLFFLMIFYLKDKKDFKKTIFGTFLALSLILYMSLVLNYTLHQFIDIEKYSNYFIAAVLVYIVFRIYISIDDEDKESQDEEKLNHSNDPLLNKASMLWISFITYIVNGGDDLITYTSFTTNFTIFESIKYALGVFIGLAILVFFVIKFVNYVKNNNKEFEIRVKKIFMFIAIVMIFYYIWWLEKVTIFSLQIKIINIILLYIKSDWVCYQQTMLKEEKIILSRTFRSLKSSLNKIKLSITLGGNFSTRDRKYSFDCAFFIF